MTRRILLREEAAIGTLRFTVLLQHISVEKVAGVGSVSTACAGTVLDVLCLSVRST